MVQENWANLRLTVQLVPTGGFGSQRARLYWRLSAKAPSEAWDRRSDVALGQEIVEGVPWPPSRDDMLAAMTEVLMGVRWTEPPF